MRWRAGGGSRKRCFYKRRFLQVGRAEVVKRSPWGVVRLSPQLPGCERIRDQRKRQELENPSRGLRRRGLLLDLEQQIQKHRPWVEVGRFGAR